MRTDGAALTAFIFFSFFLEGHMIVNMVQTRTVYSSIIDKYQHMHFFTFNTVSVQNVNFNVKIRGLEL